VSCRCEDDAVQVKARVHTPHTSPSPNSAPNPFLKNQASLTSPDVVDALLERLISGV